MRERAVMLRLGLLFITTLACVVTLLQPSRMHVSATITPTTINTVAGGGTGDNEGGLATQAAVIAYAIGVDAVGTVYIHEGCRVRKVAGGIISTIVGTGTCGFAGDGGPALSAQISGGLEIFVAPNGDLYLRDSICRLRKVTGGIIDTIAGTGPCHESPDGPVQGAMIEPDRIGMDAAGNIYFYDVNRCQLREISGGLLTTLLSSDCPGLPPFRFPQDIAVDAAGDVFLQDRCETRRWSAGVVSVVPGASCATSGIASGSTIELDAAGDIFIGDWCDVVEVRAGAAVKVAGTGACTYSGDGLPSLEAGIDGTRDLVVDSAGDIYISTGDGTQAWSRVRVITPPGPDTDGDGYPDGIEAALGKDPNVACAIMRADINMDGVVNGLDLNALGKQFLKAAPPANARVDQNGDNVINGLDLNMLAKRFLQSMSACP